MPYRTMRVGDFVETTGPVRIVMREVTGNGRSVLLLLDPLLPACQITPTQIEKPRTAGKKDLPARQMVE